jgi:hypothetical protein
MLRDAAAATAAARPSRGPRPAEGHCQTVTRAAERTWTASVRCGRGGAGGGARAAFLGSFDVPVLAARAADEAQFMLRGTRPNWEASGGHAVLDPADASPLARLPPGCRRTLERLRARDDAGQRARVNVLKRGPRPRSRYAGVYFRS